MNLQTSLTMQTENLTIKKIDFLIGEAEHDYHAAAERMKTARNRLHANQIAATMQGCKNFIKRLQDLKEQKQLQK